MKVEIFRSMAHKTPQALFIQWLFLNKHLAHDPSNTASRPHADINTWHTTRKTHQPPMTMTVIVGTGGGDEKSEAPEYRLMEC